MQHRRAILLAVLVALSLVAMPLSVAGGVAAAPAGIDSTVSEPTIDATGTVGATATVETQQTAGGDVLWADPATVGTDQLDAGADRLAVAQTNETIGYVDGYWYDDELPVDERDDATVSEDELEAVVSRSMARTEVIRELTFEERPDVEVITREQFQDESEEMFGDPSDRDLLVDNVRYEAKLMVERDRDSFEALQELYGDAVAGYYSPAQEQIVLISDDLEAVEVDEVTLGHELLHALQDQHFGLDHFDRETMEADATSNGLIEGDAVFVDSQYEERCGAEWDCLEPTADPPTPGDIVYGQFFSLIMPYDEGPDYVEYVYEQGGWDAVNALYDDPPTSTSEIIRPDEEREPVDVEVEDRSDDTWNVVDPDEGPTTQVVGEAGIASKFMHDSLERMGESVIGIEDFLVQEPDGSESYVYDQPYTDGWKGDGLVVYATDDEDIDESGYVWELAWVDEEQADQFLEGYLELLDLHDGEPVDGHQDTITVEGDFPGAYFIDQDGDTVTIVNAPSVEDLSSIVEGAAPEGEDTMAWGPLEGPDDDGDDTDDADDADDDSEAIPGFGPLVALLAVLLAVALLARR